MESPEVIKESDDVKEKADNTFGIGGGNNLPVNEVKKPFKFKNFFSDWLKDPYNEYFLIILVVALVIRFLVFLKTQDQTIWWDAADYLATGKRWAGINPHFVDIWYYRRGFFWALFSAIFFKIGLGETGIRLSIVLFSTGIVLISYLFLSEMFNKKIAFLTSIAMTFSWVYLFFTGRPLTNIPATFFLITSLLFFWKGYVKQQGNKFTYFFGLFFALALLTRMQYAMFALPLLVFVILKEKHRFLLNKHLWITVVIFAVVFIPQLYLHTSYFGNPVTDILNYYFGVEGISQSGEVGGTGSVSTLFVYFTNLPYMLDGNSAGYNSLFVLSPMYILFIIGIFFFFFDLIFGMERMFSGEKVQKRLFILIWIISGFMFLGWIAPHLEQRYMMQTFPFLFVIAVYPLLFIQSFIEKKFNLSKKRSLLIVSTILIALLIPNMIFANNLIEGSKSSYNEVKLAGEWIKENSNPEDIIISASMPQNTYYSERPTYKFYLANRRDQPHKNETDFYEFIETYKPKYMVLSVFEVPASHTEWGLNYPQNFPDKVKPVQVYTQNGQPVLIIYEFIYNNSSSGTSETPVLSEDVIQNNGTSTDDL